MATTKGQRIGIWSIAILMIVGSIGSFAIIVLANMNNKSDTTRMNELMAQYQADVNAQTKDLSQKYYGIFSPFQSRVAPFDSVGVAELASEDLVTGDGNTITANSSYSAYYIGWGPDGKIFDSSIEDGALKAPLEVTPGGVIEGWTKGTEGMKVNGIREITIPSDLAYGERGSGSSIPPNTPLKFVVMIIPTPEPVEVPAELLKYYRTGGN